MRFFIRALFLALVLLAYGCKSAKNAAGNAAIDPAVTMDITMSDMNKDAIRLKGLVMKANGEVEKRNSYDFKVQEVIQYGPTFSSAEPKVGEIVNLMTPADVKLNVNQVVILDVLTPKFGQKTSPMRVRLGQP